ncbi:Atu4866 domain-containing protein [Brucella sp. NBRC 12950]|uniref:Atu4866 domain-containing protein n=1 Tax=Brucella sp. NBRC 12950 TaxID=2994518 RepID=UPI0024A345D0|nr:Atu4866 domain-containing protein [Brucella sp. NBRC 12950]GLU30104.1 hypothetical protein Brsp01_53370 [Brucella sp. NBRC 12950]
MKRVLVGLATATVLSQTFIEAKSETLINHAYVGLWETDDGYIRHELPANGRYVEARGTRERAYEGRYELKGNYIKYWDDTGFTADGHFINDILHHAGMILYRR